MAFLGADNLTISRVRNDLRATSLRTKASSRLPVLPLSAPGVTTRPKGSLLYDTDSDLVHYSDGLQWIPFGTGTTQTADASIVWMPFGEADENTGTTWEEVYSLIQEFPPEKRKVVYLDNYKAIENNEASLFEIPNGVYDVHGVEFKYVTTKNFTPPVKGTILVDLMVDTNVKLNGLRKISGSINVNFDGKRTGDTTPGQTGACVDISTLSDEKTSETVILEGGVHFSRPGVDPSTAAPFFEFNNISGSPAESFGEIILKDRVFCDQNAVTFGFLGDIATGVRLTNPPTNELSIIVKAEPNCFIQPGNFVSLETVNGTNQLGFSLTLDIVGNFNSYVGLENLHTDFVSLNPRLNQSLNPRFRRRDTILQRYITNIDPTIINNFDQGFERGDIWINTVDETSWICTNSGAGNWSLIN